MTQEQKELLLKDLCMRLPYGVKIDNMGEPSMLTSINNRYRIIVETGEVDENPIFNPAEFNVLEIEDAKPYLFPISSMTEEQKEEYYSLADDVTIKPGQGSYFGIKIHCIKLGISDNPHEEVWDYIDLDAIDWLNKNHFDYQGLIEKGLAIDATGKNIY